MHRLRRIKSAEVNNVNFFLLLQTSKSEGSEGTDGHVASGSGSNAGGSRSCLDKSTASSTIKKTIKKKTVTFKSCLETSDDLNIVRKEPNLHITPPVPIIKKESFDCLSRATKVARGKEPIVLESRLNYSGDIDKLNSLSRKLKFSRNYIDDDEEEDPEDDDDGANSDEELNDSDDDEDNVNDSDDSGSNGGDSEDEGTMGLKRSLPKIRQSRRSKKPNKRFLDDVALRLARTGKKLDGRKKLSRNGDSLSKHDNFVERALSLRIDGNAGDSERGSGSRGNCSMSSNAKEEEFYSLYKHNFSAADRYSFQLRNNPFTKVDEKMPSISSSNSKVILRESRLSFPSTFSPSLSTNAIKDNPFSSSMHSSSMGNGNNKGMCLNSY